MAAAARLILLTGAGGFVGRQVLRALAECGCKVRVVVRQGSQHTIADQAAIESVVTTADLWAEDTAWCAQACRAVDTVIHAAWYAESGRYLQSEKNTDCLAGTLRLAQGAAAAGVRRFVGIGSCFEYDPSGGTLSTKTPLKPETPYAKAKVDTYRALTDMLPRQHVEFVWCRLFYLYGEGEDPRRLVPYIRAQLAAGAPAELSAGTQVRDYIDVREAGSMIADAALGTVQGPVNICTGIGMTVRQIAERIADDYGRRDLLRFGVRPANLTDPPCIVGVRA